MINITFVLDLCWGYINLTTTFAFVYSYFRGGSGSELHAKGRELGSGPVSLGLEK